MAPFHQEQCEAQESLSVRVVGEGPAWAGQPLRLVGPGRLELPTSRLSGVRSNQAELRAYGRTTAGLQRPGSRSHTSIDRPNTGRSKREIGKRNEDGGDPHLCMALSRFR